MRGARRTAGVARGAAVLQPDPSTPLPQCIWCWMEQPDHQLKSCPEKRTPNMSDFKQARAVRTRSLGLQRSRGLPSGRTKEEQQAHEATYNTAHKQRTRALVAGAKAALAAHLEAAAQPLTPNGPCAQFTIYQLLALEFASMMDELLPAAVRAKGPVSINSSSVQRFTKLLTKPIGDALSEQAVFKSVADVRCADEPTISDFVLLQRQLTSSDERRGQMEQLLSHAKQQLRIASPYCAALRLLPRSASLLEHHRVVALASKPRQGAPPKAERAASGGGLEFAQNYEDGAHTAEYVHKRVGFDNRRFGVAATHTQADVHASLEMSVRNFPPLSSVRGHQQKRKLVHNASRSAASMWMFQIDRVTNAKWTRSSRPRRTPRTIARTWTCCSRWRHRCSRRWTAATRASALGASSAARLPPRGARARASRPPAQRATRAASRTTTTTIDRRRWGWAVNESTVLWRRAGCGVRR